MNFYVTFFARYRRLLAMAVVLTTILSFAGLGLLRFDSDPRSLLDADAAEQPELLQLVEEFGASDADCIILVTADDVTTREPIQAILTIVRRASELEAVESAFSMLSARGRRRVGRYYLPLFPLSPDASEERLTRARSEASRHPVLLGRLLSEDLTTTLINVRLAAGVRDEADVQQVVEQLRGIAEAAVQGKPIRVHLTGLPILRLDMLQSLLHDQAKFNIIGISTACLISLLVFRSAAGTLIVVLGSATGVLWTLGLLGLVGVRINVINSVIAPLVLVIGVSDAMHLLLEIRRWKAVGWTSLQAAQAALSQVGPACGLTSLTTMIGFGSLSISSIDAIQQFGIWAAAGCALNFVAVIVIVPLLASTSLGDRLGGELGHIERVARRLADILCPLIQRYRVVSICGALLTLGLLLCSLTLKAENRISETISSKREAYRSLQLCDRKFGGSLPLEVVVKWPDSQRLETSGTLQVLQRVHEAVTAQPNLSRPTSVLTLIQSLPGTSNLAARVARLRYLPETQLHRFVNAAGTRAIIRARIPDVGSRRLSPQFDQLEHDLQAIESQNPGYQVRLVGGTVSALRNLQNVVKDLWRSLSMAALIIVAVLIISLRSVGLGLASVIPNAFPLVCVAGLLVAIGQPLEMCSVIVFCVCLGIAADDTIHFLMRYQHERRDGTPPEQAVRRSIEIVGEALIMTTVVLTIGIGSVMLSEIPALRTFGRLATLALLTALAGDLLILPALLLWVESRRQPDSREKTG